VIARGDTALALPERLEDHHHESLGAILAQNALEIRLCLAVPHQWPV
jgi:hypothetical protein